MNNSPKALEWDVSLSESETVSKKNHQYRQKGLLPSLRSVPIILSAPPAKLSWFCWSSKCCAVCGQRPPAGTVAIPIGPRIVRKQKTPLPSHFVIVRIEQQSTINVLKGDENKWEGGRKSTTICCCRECFDFFRTIVVSHQDCAMMTASPMQMKCVDGTENCAIIKGEKRCTSCWLDRCLMVGLTAKAVSTGSCFNWASNGERVRLEELDAAFQRRRNILRSLQNSKIMSIFQIVDEKVLEICLLKTMSYEDEQFTALRLASSAKGRISQMVNMFEKFAINDLMKTSPILLGSAHNQKLLLFNNNFENCFDCAFPSFTIDQSKFQAGEYVTIWLEHSDPIFTHMFFSPMDIFMCFELAHTMPIFRLLDEKDMKLQLAFAAVYCRELTQVSFSASLNAPELINPGGIMPHRTLMTILRKAWNLILNKEHFDVEQKNPCGTKYNPELVPVNVLAKPQLLIELEQCSQKHRVDILKPFLNAKPTKTEVLLLRAMLMTSPNTSGLSENARMLLDIEWNKYAKLLQSHLRAELGSSKAVAQRHNELMGLLETIVEIRALTHKFGQLIFQVLNVPAHRHQKSFSDKISIKCNSSFPIFMKECRYAYDTDDVIVNRLRINI